MVKISNLVVTKSKLVKFIVLCFANRFGIDVISGFEAIENCIICKEAEAKDDLSLQSGRWEFKYEIAMELFIFVIVVKLQGGVGLSSEIFNKYLVDGIPAGGTITSTSRKDSGGKNGRNCECGGVHNNTFLIIVTSILFYLKYK